MTTTTRAATLARIGRATWMLIAAIVAAVQFFRGQWIDGAIFAAALLALALDGLGVFPAVVSRGGRFRVPTIAIAVAVLLVVLAFAPRHGVVAGATMAVIGAVAVVLAWPDRPRAPGGWTPAALRAGVAWSVLGVVTCLWELTTYFLGTYAPNGRVLYPALSDLLDPVVTGPAGQGVFAAAWLGVGVVLLRGALVRGRGR